MTISQHQVSLIPMDPRGGDRVELIDFLTRNIFPFHVGSQLTADDAAQRIDGGGYDGDSKQSYWLDIAEIGRIGMVTLEDLNPEDAPLIDLRLDTTWRGQGLGVSVLRAIADFVFRSQPGVDRLEGQTREDNLAMRKVFVRAGFVKEAHYRRGWPVRGGEPMASTTYAILRSDWESGTVTPVPFNDLGY